MARALPFPYVGRVIRRPDTELAPTAPCSIWPVRSRVSPSGVAYDHEGEAPIWLAGVLTQGNVVLEVDDVQYMVIDAEANAFLPHVALILRRMRASGA